MGWVENMERVDELPKLEGVENDDILRKQIESLTLNDFDFDDMREWDEKIVSSFNKINDLLPDYQKALWVEYDEQVFIKKIPNPDIMRPRTEEKTIVKTCLSWDGKYFDDWTLKELKNKETSFFSGDKVFFELWYPSAPFRDLFARTMFEYNNPDWKSTTKYENKKYVIDWNELIVPSFKMFFSPAIQEEFDRQDLEKRKSIKDQAEKMERAKKELKKERSIKEKTENAKREQLEMNRANEHQERIRSWVLSWRTLSASLSFDSWDYTLSYLRWLDRGYPDRWSKEYVLEFSQKWETKWSIVFDTTYAYSTDFSHHYSAKIRCYDEKWYRTERSWLYDEMLDSVLDWDDEDFIPWYFHWIFDIPDDSVQRAKEEYDAMTKEAG